MSHPELAPEGEQTEVTVRLSRDSVRALETAAAEYGLPRTWIVNVVLQHLAGCEHARGELARLARGEGSG